MNHLKPMSTGVAQISNEVLDTGGTLLTVRWMTATALLAVVGYGLHRRRAQDARRRYWPKVPGRVMSERESGYGAGDSVHLDSVVAFRTLDGAVIQGVPRGGVYLGRSVIGRTVPVWYDPRDPNLFEARINALDRAGSIPFLIALLLAVLGLVSLLK